MHWQIEKQMIKNCIGISNQQHYQNQNTQKAKKPRWAKTPRNPQNTPQIDDPKHLLSKQASNKRPKTLDFWENFTSKCYAKAFMLAFGWLNPNDPNEKLKYFL